MILSAVLVLLLTASTSSGYTFGRKAKVQAVTEDTTPPSEIASTFNPSELLDFKSHKPEVYTNALVELKRLEQEPICHRTAAQLLMNNCRGIEESGASNNQWDTSHLQRHHVESFANGLTMCDAERAKWDIPVACKPFESAALYRAARDKHSRLEISHQQVGDCIEALGRDHSQWTTFINAREKAVTICGAARLDIEKDQAIDLQRHLVELMQQFTADLEVDLQKLKDNVAEGSRQASTFVDTIVTQAENGKAKLDTVFESVTDDIKGVDSAIRSIRESGNDIMRMFKLSLQTMIQGNAEMAAEQDQAIEVATHSLGKRVGNINALVGQTEASVLLMQDSLQQLIPMVVALHERQNMLEERAQAALSAMINATELLQSHSQNLHQASIKASGINDNLDRAVLTAQAWQETLTIPDTLPNWAIRVLFPTGTLILGSFGVPHSLGCNLMLLTGGFLAGEVTIHARQIISHSLFTSMIFENFVSWPEYINTSSDSITINETISTIPGENNNINHNEMI